MGGESRVLRPTLIPDERYLHLRLDLLKKSLELVHICLLLRPTHPKTFRLTQLRNLRRSSS